MSLLILVGFAQIYNADVSGPVFFSLSLTLYNSENLPLPLIP